MAKKPPSKYEAERLAFFKKTRRSLKQFDIDPTEGSGWTTTIGMSSSFADDEEATAGPAPSDDTLEIPEPTELPPPSEIHTLQQSTKVAKYTARPDLFPDFYEAGPNQSTCVQAMQWIPTRVQEVSSEVDAEATPSGVFGDIIVVFARPSKVQEAFRTGAMYVYKNNTETMWGTLSKSSSVGRTVKLLIGGELFSDEDGAHYKDLHKNTIDPETDSPWALWIFDEAWGLRANNASKEYREIKAHEKKVAEPVKYRFD